MSSVINSIKDFDFNKLTLGNTQGMQGGGYFTQLNYDNNLFIMQTPKCYTKKGICKNGKKIYCDLKYCILDKNESDFIDWLYKVEERVIDLIYQTRDEWFVEPPTKEDLEYMWNSSIRNFKSDCRLVRTFVQKPKQMHKGPTITIYDENEHIKSLDSITKDSRMIVILELLGIKWTSQSAQLDICLRQAMLLEDKPLFTKCLISNNFKNNTSKNDNSQLENLDDSSSDASNENNSQKNANTVQEQGDLTNQATENETSYVGESIMSLQNTPQNRIPICKDVEDMQDSNGQNDNTIKNINNNIDETKSDKNEPISTDPLELENSSNLFLDIKENKAEFDSNTTENTVTQNKCLENPQPSPTAKILDNDSNLEKANIDEFKNKSSIDLEPLEKKSELHEVEINFPDINDSISLKNPNEVYIEIYKEARKKAQQAKKLAIEAYLEAKRIKSVYLLDEIDSDSDDDSENESFI